MKKGTIKITITVLTFIWLGMVLGISFMEAPLKFTAPNITRELGLGIGKVVFTALNRVELGLALVILIGLLLGKFPKRINVLYGISMAILAVQTLWLLPVLDRRIDLILAGQDLPATYHHITFIILEVCLVVMLVISGINFLKRVVMK